MSSAAAAPGRAGPGTPAPLSNPAARRPLATQALPVLALAGAVIALAFLTSADSDPAGRVGGGYAWSEIAVTLLGAAGCAAAVALSGRGRLWGLGPVAMFAALTAFAALSILWSVAPDWSWYGANQLLCYLAAFAGATALARVAPERWPAAIGGVALAMALLSGWSLLAKAFPATLAADNTYGRLQAPFGYWNAVGVAAAIGVPALLWAGSRRGGPRIVRALCAPGLTVTIAAVVLSYSRSSALAAALGAACLIALVPLRLRTVLVGLIGGLGAIPIVIWALGDHALTGDHVAIGAQDAAGHSFAVVAAVVLVVVLGAGWAVAVATERVTVSEPIRRRAGTALLAVAALAPVLAVIALSASSRGLTGEISHAWSTLTSSQATVLDNSARLTQLGSSRPMYWHQGLQVGGHALLKGSGELGYGIARLAYTTSPAKTDQAHSYLVQTFADLGLVGVAITLVLLAAWALAAARALGGRASWHGLTPERAAERAGLAAMAAVTVAFGVQSALDWTWYFPGVAIPALICAGWLAGRGPLAAPIGRRAAGTRLRDRPAARAAGARLRDRPAAGALITAIATVALVGAWLMWQPLRSANAYDAAAAANTNAAALAHARTAAAANPLAVEPLTLLATIYQGLGDDAAARAQLTNATRLQPRNPEPWVALGSFDAQTGHRAAAIAAMSRVLALDHTPDDWTATARQTLAQMQASH